MSQADVGRLYDALQALEGGHRSRGAYPVHKKLRFDEPGIDDIYDWILARIDLPDHGRVLDAGCGVGFGSLRLAQERPCHVTGISLSAMEIARARAAAQRTNVVDRVEFRRMSFDDLPSAAYDVVVAVESLKHSADLDKSLRSVRRCLRLGGQLVIVEDLRNGPIDADIAGRLAADWELTSMYTERDFLAALGSKRCTVVDLSDHVRCGTMLGFGSRFAVLEILLRLCRPKRFDALRAYRGGLHLERLYAKGQMTYKAIFYSHDDDSLR